MIRPRRGFTLVEMLVTVTILAILAAFVYGAMSAAETTAKTAKTRATIAKLHRLIMARYESFKTRRIPIDFSFRADTGAPINPPLSAGEMADVRLDAIREIMRQELPERLSDITNRPENLPLSGSGWQKISPSNARQRIVPPTSICQAYYEFYQQMVADRRPPNTTNSSAECLYLVVTISCPGGREQFSENEISDTDADGWPEFIDGWGRPISFFRWAPRFIPQYNADSLLQTGNATLQHDPFDTQNRQPTHYQLIPLIYSYGPDGVGDLLAVDENTYARVILNSGQRNPFALSSGQPSASLSGGLRHFDNIHNHRLEVR